MCEKFCNCIDTVRPYLAIVMALARFGLGMWNFIFVMNSGGEFVFTLPIIFLYSFLSICCSCGLCSPNLIKRNDGSRRGASV